jgi:hypothetical protein
MTKKKQSKGGALATSPKSNLERVSAGVYRNDKGQLTGPGGRVLPNQPSRQPDQMRQAAGEAMGKYGAAGGQTGQALADALQSMNNPSAPAQPMGKIDQVANAAMAQNPAFTTRPTGPLTPEQMTNMSRIVSGINGPLQVPYTPEQLAQISAHFSPGRSAPAFLPGMSAPTEAMLGNGQGMVNLPNGQGMVNLPNGQGMVNLPAQMPTPTLEELASSGYGPSANQGGKYRLSPGVYGTQAQAQQAFQRQQAQGMANAASRLGPNWVTYPGVIQKQK